jgi:hypothetical protein
MWCMKCNKDLMDCICLDRAERIGKIMDNPFIASRKCEVCKQHYALCKCEYPIWKVGPNVGPETVK